MRGYMEKVGHGFVELVDYMGADLTHVNAARVSLGKRSNTFNEKDAKLVAFLALSDPQHSAPFRHAQVQFHIKAPEFVARQWYKHQVGTQWDFDKGLSYGGFNDTAWNEISGRYQIYNEFWLPDYFRTKADGVKQGSDDVKHKNNDAWMHAYKKHVESTEELYKDMILDGIPPEQARTILGMNVMTEWYWTTSFQAIAHFVRLRDEEHAQKEIRDYAVIINNIMSKLFPAAWEYRHRL